MSDKKKTLIGWIGFGIVFFHSFMIITFAMPYGVLPEKMVQVSSYYVDPIFHQKWSMFAPCPLLDQHAEVNYTFEDNDTTGWIWPTENAVSMHMLLRGSHHGDLAVGEYQMLHWVNAAVIDNELENETVVPESKRKSFLNSQGLYLARNYAYGFAEYLYDKKPKSAVMRCFYRNVKTGEVRSIILPEFHYD